MTEQARIIRWEDPPPARGNVSSGRRPGSEYDSIAVELRANPCRSALIREGISRATADGLTSRIRRGDIACFGPRGDFDACVRTVDGSRRVYAWYVGYDDAPG